MVSDMEPRKDKNRSKQTTIRFSVPFYNKFQTTLDKRRRKMTPVIRELVEDWVSGQTTRGALSTPELTRSYLDWLPMVAAVKDMDGRVLYANHEFLDLVKVPDDDVVGKKPSEYTDKKSAELIMMFDRQVREVGKPIVCIEQHVTFAGEPHDRMAIRFPIFSGGDLELTGVLGLSLEQMRMVVGLDTEPGGRRQCQLSSSPAAVRRVKHCLRQFVEVVPAIATVKDPQGRLLYVNPEYTTVLGKQKRAVEGRLSREIWDGPIADLIYAHDDMVRDTGKRYASIERIPIANKSLRDRLNFRFPIFDSCHNLLMTGTIGFDYGLIRRGVELLSTAESRGRSFLFEDGPDSLKPIDGCN